MLFGLLALALFASCKKDAPSTDAAGSASANSGAPKLVLEATEYDFGTVTEGETVKHSFTVKNEGGAPLVIKQTKTTCGCTVAALEKKELGPGESTKVDVSFNTRNRNGKQTKKITFVSNDPQSPQQFTIKADVVSLLGFEPRHVQLATSHGKEVTREVWLTGKLAESAKLEIEKVDGAEFEGAEAVAVELAEDKAGDKPKTGLRFTAKANKVGFGRGTVEVKTGVAEVPTLKLWFNWNVAGNLQGIPRNLYFSGKGTGGRERIVRVRSKLEGFKLVSARVVDGPFKAVIETPDAGGGKQIRVTVTIAESAALPDKPQNGKLEIVTNDPLEPKKVVDLTLRAPRGPRAGRPMPPPPHPPRPPHPARPPRPAQNP